MLYCIIYIRTYICAYVCVHKEFYIHKEENSVIGKNVDKEREYYPKLGKQDLEKLCVLI